MSFLGFRERAELRRTVARGIRSGQLPQSASIVLYNPDAFAELEQQVYGQAQADLAAAGTTPTPGAPAHPILNWIVTHAPQILAFVLAILPLFGVSIPPISIPGLPPITPKPTPTPTPTPTVPAGSGASPIDPTQPAPIPHSSEFNPTHPGYASMPTDFAVPALVTALTPLAEQIAAQALATVLPTIEAKVEGWIKSHLKAA